MTGVSQFGGPGPGGNFPPGDAPVQDQRSSSKASTFQIVAQLALPIALTAVAFFRPYSWWFWGLVGLAFVPVAPRLYGPVKTAARRWWAQIQDDRVAREVYPEFQRFVSRFSEFIDTSSSNKLGDIVEQRLKRETVTSPNDLGMTEERVLAGFWEQLRGRAAATNPDREAVATLVHEFNHLLNQYLSETVRPVFDRMSPKVRESLPDRAKRELEAFREKLVQYLHDYDDFATKLSESFQATDLDDPYLPRPEPHT